MVFHLPSQRGDIRPFSRRTNSSIISSSFPACARGQAQNVHPISVIFCGFSPKGNMRACPVGLFLRTALNWSSAQNRSVRVVAGFCVHLDAFLEDLGVCFKNKYKRKYKYKCKYNKTICQGGFCVHLDSFLEDLSVCFKNKYKSENKYKCKYNKTICQGGFCVHPDVFLEDLRVCFKNKYRCK